MNKALLAACVALLLTPVGVLALRKYSPALWERISNFGASPETMDFAPAPAAPGPPPSVPPGPPPPPAPTGLPSSLGIVRGLHPPSGPLPRPSLPPGAVPTPPPVPRPASDRQPTPRPPTGKKDFPRLNPTRGWVYPSVRSRQNPGVSQTLAQVPADAPEPPAAPAPPEPPKPKTEPSPVAPAAKIPPPEAAKRLRRAAGGGRGGGAVQYGGKVLPQASVGPGGPMGVIEHGSLETTLPAPPSPSASAPVRQSPPDALPPPNPEHPATSDGPCPKKGWWKNDGTKMCYFTKESCLAGDNNRSACAQK